MFCLCNKFIVTQISNNWINKMFLDFVIREINKVKPSYRFSVTPRVIEK